MSYGDGMLIDLRELGMGDKIRRIGYLADLPNSVETENWVCNRFLSDDDGSEVIERPVVLGVGRISYVAPWERRPVLGRKLGPVQGGLKSGLVPRGPRFVEFDNVAIMKRIFKRIESDGE